jgi:hypothetical protein
MDFMCGKRVANSKIIGGLGLAKVFDAETCGSMAGMNKRQRFYEKVEEAKERYRSVSSELLIKQLPFMSIKECVIAAKAVLAEQDQEKPMPSSDEDIG